MRNMEIEQKIGNRLENNNNVWVVGDIHGYYDSFVKLVSKLKLDDGDLVISICLLYTSPSPRDATLSRMPSSA